MSTIHCVSSTVLINYINVFEYLLLIIKAYFKNLHLHMDRVFQQGSQLNTQLRMIGIILKKILILGLLGSFQCQTLWIMTKNLESASRLGSYHEETWS